jgi:predicted glutamine amidotransferase
VDFSQHTTPNDIVSVIATRPLTRDERWTPLGKRSLAAFSGGKRVA